MSIPADQPWLHHVSRYNPSPLGLRVAEVLHHFYRGLHHMDPRTFAKTRWADPYHIEVLYGDRGLATWDYNHLTLLVVLTHDAMLRLEIEPATFRYFRLNFWQRHTRDRAEGMAVRLPSLEEHVAMIRERADLRPASERPAPDHEVRAAIDGLLDQLVGDDPECPNCGRVCGADDCPGPRP